MFAGFFVCAVNFGSEFFLLPASVVTPASTTILS
jgi:hypothetical protein